MPSLPKPGSYPEWASDASADKTPTPSAAQQQTGWVSAQKPPHNFFNWFQNLVYEWVRYFDVRDPQAYTSAANALATMVAGDIGVLNEHDPNEPIGGVIDQVQISAAASNVQAITVDGEAVFVAYIADAVNYIRRYTRDLGTVDWTVNRGANPTSAMHSDGNHLYVVSGNTLRRHLRTTGALDTTWATAGIYNHGAAIEDVVSNGVNIWIAGATSGGVNVRRLNTSGVPQVGLLVANHVSDWQLHVRGSELYAAHIVTTPGVDSDLHKINVDGVTTTDVAVHYGTFFLLLNDSVFVHRAAAAATDWTHRSLWDLTEINNGDLPTGDVPISAAYDGKYLVYTNDGPNMLALDDTVFAPQWRHILTAGSGDTLVEADAGKIYWFTEDSVAGDLLLSTGQTGVRHRLVRRCSGSDYNRSPFQHLLIPTKY